MSDKTRAIMTLEDANGENFLITQELADLSEYHVITEKMYPDFNTIFREDANGHLQVIPAKFIQFANKHGLLVRPAEYSDICGRYLAVFFTDNYVFSKECFEEWRDCVEDYLDMFPDPADFATNDELKRAYSNTIESEETADA